MKLGGNTKKMSSGDILKTIPREKDYPDLQTLLFPPSSQQPRPQVTLSAKTNHHLLLEELEIVFVFNEVIFTV
jgi:hypothetical protein